MASHSSRSVNNIFTLFLPKQLYLLEIPHVPCRDLLNRPSTSLVNANLARVCMKKQNFTEGKNMYLVEQDEFQEFSKKYS